MLQVCVCTRVLCVSAFLWHDMGSRERLFLSLTNDDADDADVAVFMSVSLSSFYPFLTHSSQCFLFFQNLCLCSFPSIFVLYQQQTGDEIPSIYNGFDIQKQCR